MGEQTQPGKAEHDEQRTQAQTEALEEAEKKQAAEAAGALQEQPAQADLADEEQPQEDGEPELEKEFTLNFHILPEDLYEFHLEMGREQVVKNSKRTKIMGWIEVAFGGMYFISLIISGATMPLQYLLSALLVGMGIYGITFYKKRFYKNLRKATDRQHAKTPYFQNAIVVDFYPNKCAEYVGDGMPKDTFWRMIDGVRETDRSYIIDLGQKRCLLLPKEGLGEQAAQLDAFLTRVCENYEKPRVRV